MGTVQKFFQEVRVELGKVTWPSWRELLGSTAVVLVVLVVVAFYLGVADYALKRVVSGIFNPYRT